MVKTQIAIALGVAASIAFGTWYVTDLHWENKWQQRDIVEGKQREDYLKQKADIEHNWATQFANIQSWYQEELENNRNEADKTIAAYRAGNLKLRKQFTCLSESMSDTSTIRQVTDAGRKCGLQSGDVEFLIRYAERAQAIVIKYNKSVKALKSIYGEKP